MSTPHNEAEKGDIAKVVLMPGDPLRAKYIADHYLQNVKQFNHVRNMFGYTGTYKDKKVSIMGSGMGMASIGIYSYELFKFYDVEIIIRIGSAGSYCEDLQLFDLVLAEKAWSESSFAKVQGGVDERYQYPSANINEEILRCASKLDIKIQERIIHSSDVFYHEEHVGNHDDFKKEHGCACVEMESYALFHNASILGKQAACLLTISDSLITHQETSAKQREKSFDQMMVVALESAITL